MRVRHLSFLFVTLLFICVSIVCSAEVILPYPDGGHGYKWLGSSDLHIISSGEYAFSDASFSDIIVHVQSSGVRLDGLNAGIRRINGRSDLNLKNINIYIDEYDYSGSAISECHDIVGSSIVLKSNQEVAGIGILYGTIDDTIITVHSTGARGIVEVYGIISGGEFTVTGQRLAFGIGTAYGTISGGIFTVSGDLAHGVTNLIEGSTISGGKFIVNGDTAYGVVLVHGGIISGGEFIVSGRNAGGVVVISGEGESPKSESASSIGEIDEQFFEIVLLNTSGFGNEYSVIALNEEDAFEVDMGHGIVSGGEFTVTGQKLAFGVGHVDGIVSGGTFTITSQGIAVGVDTISGAVSGGIFTINGKDAVGVWEVSGTDIVIESRFTDTLGEYVPGVDEENGILSEGRFVVTSQKRAAGIVNVFGTVSGGVFTINGEEALGVSNASGIISGGLFTVIATKEQACGIFKNSENSTLSGGLFLITSPFYGSSPHICNGPDTRIYSGAQTFFHVSMHVLDHIMIKQFSSFVIPFLNSIF